jgi:hypothetical protein
MLVLMLGCAGGGPETFEDFRSEFAAVYVERCTETKCYPVSGTTLQPLTDCDALANDELGELHGCGEYDPAAAADCLESEWVCDQSGLVSEWMLDVGAACALGAVCPD